MVRIKRRALFIAVGLSVLLIVAGNAFLVYAYRLPILMYHSIDYTSDESSRMFVSPDIFTKQMKYLHDKRYNVVSLQEAVSYIKERKRPPKHTVAITLDDGYKNNYKYVYPVLKKYNIPATIFVATDLIGNDPFLDWEEIKDMSSSGIVNIESHTKSHKWLTSLGAKDLKEEMAGSKKIIEEALRKKVSYVCYPMGGYNERVKRAAKDAGYEAGFATKPKRISSNYDLYEIKRIRISPTANNLFIFWIKLSGYHAFFRVVQNDYKEIPYLLWKKKESS